MRKEDQKRAVLRLLSEKSTVSVAALSGALRVSEVTVRKLLLAMEQEGMLRRTWGGAVGIRPALEEPSYEERTRWRAEEKEAIARVAFGLIQDGDAVFLDSGTTTMRLARMLAEGEKRRVMVVTNAINIAQAFHRADDMQVVLVGGEFRSRTLSCTGGMAREALRTLFFDKAFVTGGHFSVERGFTTPNLSEAELTRTVLGVSKASYMLIDSSKYGADSLSLIAPCGAVGTLITDWRAPAEALRRFAEAGMRVLCAQEEG